MSALLDAAVAAQDAQDAVEPEVVPTDTPLTPAAPTPTAKPPISLDDILPDTDDLPPTLRGKSVRALADDRRTTVHQRDAIGTEKNNIESQLRVAQAALAVLGQVPQRQPEAPPAKPTSLDLLKRRGIDTAALLTDPERVLAGAIDAGAELAKAELAGEIQSLQQRLDDLTGERAVEKTATANERIRSAHTQAGHTLKVDPKQWVEDAEFITSFVLSRGLAVDDPQSYVTAGEALYKRTGAAAPTPAPAPAPAAPPVGNGIPAPVAAQGNGSAVASLTARERQDFDDIIAGFGERIKITAEGKEKIASEVIAMRKRRRG